MRTPREIKPIRVWIEPIDPDNQVFAVNARFVKMRGACAYGLCAFAIVDYYAVAKEHGYSWQRAGEHFFHERLRQSGYLPYLGPAERFA